MFSVMTGTERQADLEMHNVQLQSHVDLALKDKQQVHADLDGMREKLRHTLSEKIEIENDFHMIQKHEMRRLAELETKFEEISQQYINTKEENAKLIKDEHKLQKAFQDSESGRLVLKEQYLEMKQLNKDLKLHFI